MSYQTDFNNQRRDSRVSAELPVLIRIGTQFSLKGQLRDLSLKSAYIRIKSSIYLQSNDEVGFSIQAMPDKADEEIHGLARISRIVPGEGFAVYFTKMEDDSLSRLKSLLKTSAGSMAA